ncbi:Methionyl-tRNA formyltransferase [Sporomusa rhizae]|uniref:formyltransferase family protein n=1 Tax=Sporomusa rhizae TaxID=357999 RepID=UPI00352AC7AE
MKVNFIGNFDEAFYYLVNNEYEINYYFFQSGRASKMILLFCKTMGIPTVEIKNAEDFQRNEINKLFNERVINIIASFGIIIPNELTRQYVFINVHPGILPDYRGRHPLPQAIVNQEKYAGITVHIISPNGIDTGKILGLEKVEIDYSENYKYNELKLRGLIQSVLHKAIHNYLNQKYLGESSDGSYYKPLTGDRLNLIFSVSRLIDLRD